MPNSVPPRVRLFAVAGAMVCSVVFFPPPRSTKAQDSPPLPSEAKLPGAAANDPASADLPPESQLPGDGPVNPGSAKPGPTGDLPGENVIPGEVGGDQTVAGEDRTSAALPGQIQPLLRLDFDGHAGVVRTMDISDGGRTLVTAGEDKDVHVWRRTDIGVAPWLHRRTIRWPITRGPRGRIYSARLRGDLVAFAGHGGFGGAGEIRIVDAASGDLVQTLVGDHRQVIVSLAWAPGDAPLLASVDMEGRLIAWSPDPATGLWSGTTLVDHDTVTYGKAVADALRSLRDFIPVSFSDANHVIVPQYVGMTDQPVGALKWHLARIDVRDRTSVLLDNFDHLDSVVDSSSTPDGSVFVSCDFDGSIVIWTFRDGVAEIGNRLKPAEPPLFVDVDPSGKRLLVGTESVSTVVGKAPRAKLQLWDLESQPPTMLSERVLADHARAGVLDSLHHEAIVAQGNRIEIYSFDEAGAFDGAAPRVLAIPSKPILRVAFSRNNDPYRIAFGTQRDSAGNVPLSGVFDLSASKLLGRARIDSSDYLPPQRTATTWRIKPLPADKYQLHEAEQPRGVLPLHFQMHGLPTAICTLPQAETGAEETDEKPETGAVIVGTSGRDDIYVYAADESDPPRLLRHFRGHVGSVTSLTTSPDGKYLVSGGEDSTIAVWNLQDLFTASQSVNFWGVEFEVDRDQLIAAEVRQDGPLYFRGVRSGDRLVSITWAGNDNVSHAESDAEKMFDRLLTAPFDVMVAFRFTRLGRARPEIASYPAWRPLATLFVDQTREWAFWTPAGYYDASFNGHQRFGWQINKGIDQTPDFFRAAQFRASLERPAIMRRLLAAGSLPAAMRQSISQIGPPQGADAIVNQYRNKPQIELISPRAGATIVGDTLTVRARISVPLGASLVETRAFVSGVPAVSRTIIDTGDDPAAAKLYQWEFRLPSDKHLQLEVLAATEAEAVGRLIVDLEHRPGDTPKRNPRLHVLAIGASDYPDPQIQSLDFAADAAINVTNLFRRQSSKIYRVTTDRLVNRDATRPLWRVFAQQAADQLSETVSPDDLVIMYLCGHGLRDRRTNQWYFVTADARYGDLMNDEYGDCIAFSDLASLAKLPCRKLVILDSCHSGAVQPLMQRDDLKSALRFLQDDLVLTVTASEGDEEAAEQRESRMGRFTAKLVEALNGAADNDRDAVVTLNEVIDYVTRTVSNESAQEGSSQHPTASPHYLLRTLQLPLTTVQAQER